MFLAITEKEMEVFGIQLPERCVLMSSASSVLKDGEEQMITAASQNKHHGDVTQRIINLDGICSVADFITEVIKKNDFKPRDFSGNSIGPSITCN
jgi:hypothetical protein